MLPNLQELANRGTTVVAFNNPCARGKKPEGNSHQVFVQTLAKNPAVNLEDDYRFYSKTITSDIVVLLFIAEQSNQSHAISLRFLHYGQEILRCGSGSLAAAKILADMFPKMNRWVINTQAGMIELEKIDRHRYSLYYPLLPLTYLSSNMKWQRLVNQKISSALHIGGPNDYLCLVFNRQEQVQNLIVFAQKLTMLSRRALIATAPARFPGIDYVLRYFAPQYGNKEDSATGSAHGQAAQYWQKKLGKKQLRGIQLSKKGGYFEAEIQQQRQKLSGFVHIIC